MPATRRNHCGHCETCRLMFNFRGNKPDTDLLCIQCQCLKADKFFIGNDTEDDEEISVIPGTALTPPIETGTGRR